MRKFVSRVFQIRFSAFFTKTQKVKVTQLINARPGF